MTPGTETAPLSLLEIHDELRLVASMVDLVFRAEGAGAAERDDVLWLAERTIQHVLPALEELQAGRSVQPQEVYP